MKGGSNVKKTLNKIYGKLPQILRDFIERMIHAEVAGSAASLAFFFLLSLFPLLIILMTLLSYIQIDQEELLGFIRTFAPVETMNLIETNLADVMGKKSGTLLSIGIIATLWSASNGMNAIARALNKAYDVKENRPFIIARGLAIFLTFLMVFVFIVALILQVFGHEIGVFLLSFLHVPDQFLLLWTTLRWLGSSLIPFVIFLALYWIMPNRKLTINSAIPGAIFATIGWATTSLVFSYYVSNFGNYSATYGSIGAIIVLMIWFYLSGFIIIIGGELNALLQLKREKELKTKASPQNN